MSFIDSIVFRTWKEFSKFSGYSIQTLKLWNKKDPIPGLTKSSTAKSGVICIPKKQGRDWLLKKLNIDKSMVNVE